MKVITMVFLTFFLGKGCSDESKQDMENSVIEYIANTRGFYQKVEIKNNVFTVSKDRSGTEKPLVKKISDADWKELIKDFKEIKLNEMGSLKAPSEKRFYDGAAIATLKITYKDSIYESLNFDHGNPPVGIDKFVNKINKLAKEE
jgi:hypothetical protein